MFRQTTAAVFLIGLLSTGSVIAQSAGIQEWTVPWPNTRPRDPDVAPDGSIWLAGQAGHYVARFDPKTESFRRFELPDGAGPHNLIVDRDGSIWYAGNRQAHIGHLNADDGSIDQIAMPNPAARDPHTLVFDSRGNIWFTVQHGNFIGRLNKASKAVDLVPVPTKRSRPYGIVVDAEDRPWAVLLGTNKLATVDPETLQLQEISLPRTAARPRRIGITADGMIWYADYAKGYLGCYDPGSGQFKEWPAPAGELSQPYAMGVDGRNRIWFVETGPDPNTLVGFDPETGAFFSNTAIPSGAGAVRHMVYDQARNALWFGTDTNNLARADLP